MNHKPLQSSSSAVLPKGLSVLILLICSPAWAQTVVQSNSGWTQATATPTVAFTNANTAGNLLWVAVGSDDTINAPTDTLGNTYTLAVSVTGSGSSGNAAIYYVASAKAGSNTVTCHHPGSGDTHCHIAEISGLATTSPLDQTGSVASSSTCSVSTSGATAQSNEWVAAFFYDSPNTRNLTAGSGYTQVQFSNDTSAGDAAISESANATSTGVKTATCGGNSSDVLSQLITTFKAASGGGGAPTISSLTPSSGAVGSAIVIAGSNFGSSQGTSTVTFNGTTATANSWGASSITATVPTGASTGNVVVTVGGAASNGVSFTVVPAPNISSLSPTSGPIGTSVTITGTNFGSTQGNGGVTFNGTAATISSWSNTSVTAAVPSGATTGNVVVTAAGGVASNGVSFTVVPAPNISSLSPTSGPIGTSVTITGTNFGSTQGNGGVTFNGTAATISSWSNTSVTAAVPSGATTGNVVVTAAGGVASNGVSFTVVPAPNISSLSPTSGAVGSSVTITGTNFGATEGSGGVTFNATTAPITSWSNTSITAVVPAGASTGNVVVTVAGGVSSGGISFTVALAPTITGLQPSIGYAGSSVTVTGTNLGSTQGNSGVTFNGTAAAITSWSNTSIGVTVPSGATTGNVVVTTAGGPSNGILFTVAAAITQVSPNSGAVGTVVTITGSNFGSSQGTSTITLSDVAATPTSWSGTKIVVPVPNGVAANTQLLALTVGGVTTSVNFTIFPAITSISPSSGAQGAAISITGTSFGASNGIDTFVTFNNQSLAATPTSWTDTQIVVEVPSGASTGNINVTSNGAVSNGVNFTATSTQAPGITSLLPESGAVGTSVTISGEHFGATQGTVAFNGAAATIKSWSDGSITAVVPAAATTGNIVVTAGGIASDGVNFTVVPPPNITDVSPSSGPVGLSVTISGTSFGTPPAVGSVSFNGTVATIVTWTDTYITATVPAGATSGNLVVTDDGGVASNAVNFTVLPTYSFGVTYAPNRDVLTSTDNVNGNWTYSYDDFNRLSTAVATNGTGCSESYDQYGNRWSQQPYGDGNSCGGSSLTFTGNNTSNNNHMDGFSYDAVGNLLNDGTHAYTYDAENRIISVDNGQTATYSYDADGQRVRKVSSAGTADFLYDLGGHAITEVSGAGSWNRGEIFAGGRHIATYNNGTTYFNQSDWLGTERFRTAITGAECETITSLPFGDGQATSGACGDPSPNHFTGKERDSESGMDYFGARYYSNQLARWPTPDPKPLSTRDILNPQKLNRYTYVLNNPLKLVDLDGQEEYEIIVRRFISQKVTVAPPVKTDARLAGQAGTFRIEQRIIIETDKNKSADPRMHSSQSAGVSAGPSVGSSTIAPLGSPVGIGVGVADLEPHNGNYMTANRRANGDVWVNFVADAKYPLTPEWMTPSITHDLEVVAHTWKDGSTTFTLSGDYSVFPGLEVLVQAPGGSPQLLYGDNANSAPLNIMGPSSLLCPDFLCGNTVPNNTPGITLTPPSTPDCSFSNGNTCFK